MILKKSKHVKVVWEDDVDKMWVKIKTLSPKDEITVKSSCITNKLVDGKTVQVLDPFLQQPLEVFLCLKGGDFGNIWEDEEHTKPLKFTPQNVQLCIDHMEGFVEFVHENLMIITEENAKKKAGEKEKKKGN